MSKEEIALTAYCGLYCGDCIRYRSRAADLTRGLLSELHATEFGKYAVIKSQSVNSVRELKYYEQCCEVLEAIVSLQCNEPCRVGGGCKAFSCSIVECCQKKGYQGCWECDSYENCSQFASLKPFHGEYPLQNLRKIREFGLDRWAKHRQKFYMWQENKSLQSSE
jgi:hypothetical protein